MDTEQKTSSPKNSRKGLIIGMIIFGLVLIIAVLAYSALAPNATRSPNLQSTATSSSTASQKVPDFVVVNADGNTVSIRTFEGKPTVLNFWASTCGPCQSEMPHFQTAYEAYGDEVNFVMVDIPGFNGETTTRAERFLESNGYTFPAYFDFEGDASRVFNITSIPRTYFIDAEGNAVVMGNGALSEAALQQGLQALGI